MGSVAWDAAVGAAFAAIFAGMVGCWESPLGFLLGALIVGGGAWAGAESGRSLDGRK